MQVTTPRDTPDAVSPETRLLDDVFGPGEGGPDPVARARSSRRMFVRSHDGLAIFGEGARGLPVTATDALDAFGWDVLAGLSDKPAVGIVRRGHDAATVLRARTAELGFTGEDLAARSGVSIEDIRAVDTGGRRMPMAVLAPLAEAMGLCPVRFGAVPCRLP